MESGAFSVIPAQAGIPLSQIVMIPVSFMRSAKGHLSLCFQPGYCMKPAFKIRLRPRKKLTCLVFIWAAALFTGPAFAEDAAPVNPDWLAKDRIIMERVKSLLPPEHSAKKWIRKLKVSNTREDRSLGFGGRRYELAVYGGYATAWVTLVRFGRSIAGLKVLVATSSRNEGVIRALQEAWGKGGQPAEAGVTYEFHNPDVEEKLRHAAAAALGEAGETAVPKHFRSDFESLSDPLNHLVFGRACGIAATPPPGRQEIERLVADGRADILRLLLRSPNPEGRVYAVEGLEALADSGLAKSKGEARRLIRQGGIRINGDKIVDEMRALVPNDVQDGKIALQAGKKRHHHIHVK